jgi:ubiquinone/menaquinone biosynthesis C-methylase UbiE
MPEERDWPAIFSETFARPASAVQACVWRAVFGDEYPEGVEPFSFVTRSELGRFADGLNVSSGDTLVDVGCGRGGPGLWVAAATGAALVGIDVAETALAAARARAQELLLDDRARFALGSFERTGLSDGAADAVMSVDALLFAPDKAAAIAELHRVLRPRGRLVFTTWDYHSQPEGRPPQLDDHRPLLEATGFEVLAYDETEDWRGRLDRANAGLFASVAELAGERGAPEAEVRRDLEETARTIEAMTRRVFAVAERRG